MPRPCSVTKAAEAAQIDRTTHYLWLESDPEYKAQFEAARRLEDEAVRRTYQGVERPVYQGGKKVGVVQEYSDPLLIFLLEGARPQKYRDNVHLEGSLAVGALEQAIARGNGESWQGVTAANPHLKLAEAVGEFYADPLGFVSSPIPGANRANCRTSRQPGILAVPRAPRSANAGSTAALP